MAHIPSRRQFLLSSSLILCAVGLAPAWIFPGEGARERLARHADEVVANSNFSGAILVTRGDQVLLRRGFALADIDAGLANTPETVFRIGSISKQFTAALILRQVDSGLVDLDALAGEYWIDCPPAWSEVTVRHLLNHTSGIPNVTEQPDFLELCKLPLRPPESLALVTALPLDFEPGSAWKYSNSGYLLLALIAENVGGKPFEVLLDEQVLRPLELKHTGSEASTGPVPGLARPYGRQASGTPVAAPPIDMNFPAGGGGVHSTLDDLERWARAIEGRELLSEASWEAMLTPVLQDYGMGIVISEQAAEPCIHHGGSINGFDSWLGLFPDQGVVICVLSNVASEADPSANPQLLGVELAGLVVAPQPVGAGG